MVSATVALMVLERFVLVVSEQSFLRYDSTLSFLRPVFMSC